VKGANLGSFEELVLLAVEVLGEDAYGVTVQELAAQQAERAVSLGAVYAALDRLETKKLLRSWIEAGGVYRGGRSRRHFATTAEGRAALAEIKRQRDAMWRLIASASRRRV
jgi:DNA-binding PadR family transcriptional regulator